MCQTYTLPPRKAAPLPQSPTVEAFSNPQGNQPRSVELHSPLSPLSPGSPIYPDGIFTPLWFAKHQQQVPAMFIAFFSISADDGASQNEQIQSDINAIRTSLSRSGFKTRFAAVLLSDKSILHAPELEDKISSIRRATTLDSKTGLFFMPPMSSQAEIATFARSMLTTLQPLVVEYYRDLTKHCRRKKVRGGPSTAISSSPDGGPHTLSTPGWNARYEIKQGAFAEFRREMDVAERHYSAAIEELFGSEGVFEATVSWSSRWDQARILCDTLAMRVIRCQLCLGISTGAAISWLNYKCRMRDLIDRRGKGSQNYGWDAWESRWAEIMAQLIQHAAVPLLQPIAEHGTDDSSELPFIKLYVRPDKTASTSERLLPFSLLHHPGYWLRLAFQWARDRHLKALSIPEEDRIPPGQSPASTVAHRVNNYDTYLVPEPHEESPLADSCHVDHVSLLERLVNNACHEFSSRGQARSSEQLKFALAQQVALAGQQDRAIEILLPLWKAASWRNDVWVAPFYMLLKLLHDCAIHTGNGEIAVVTAWELLGSGAANLPMENMDVADYLTRSGLEFDRLVISIENKERIGPIAVQFAFSKKDTNVSDPLECFLILNSCAGEHTAPITISRVQLSLSNSKHVIINHSFVEPEVPKAEKIYHPRGISGINQDILNANLRLYPQETRVYSFPLTFRDADVVRLQRASLFFENEYYQLEHAFSDEEMLRSTTIYMDHHGVLEKKLLQHRDSTTVSVSPKPPKMEIMLHGLRKGYYTNEQIYIDVEFCNKEAETSVPTAMVVLSSQPEQVLVGRWCFTDDTGTLLRMNSLKQDASYKATLEISAVGLASNLTVGIQVNYTLESDAETPLSKTCSFDVNVLNPFLAKYDVGPLVHGEPWPSYFNIDIANTHEVIEGIPQNWRLRCQLTSSACDTMIIHSMRLTADNVDNESPLTLIDPPHIERAPLDPGKSMHNSFDFLTQKSSLDDRSPLAVNLLLQITWSRHSGDQEITTKLQIPRISLPSSEPRVLCTMKETTSETGEVLLQYHLENPSMHFLTFVLTMEASEAFAFSGPKYRTLSLSPLSRLRVDYQLLLHDFEETRPEPDGTRLIWPVLQVVDSYYHKQLKINPAGPGMVVDEKFGLGILIQK